MIHIFGLKEIADLSYYLRSVEIHDSIAFIENVPAFSISKALHEFDKRAEILGCLIKTRHEVVLLKSENRSKVLKVANFSYDHLPNANLTGFHLRYEIALLPPISVHRNILPDPNGYIEPLRFIKQSRLDHLNQNEFYWVKEV